MGIVVHPPVKNHAVCFFFCFSFFLNFFFFFIRFFVSGKHIISCLILVYFFFFFYIFFLFCFFFFFFFFLLPNPRFQLVGSRISYVRRPHPPPPNGTAVFAGVIAVRLPACLHLRQDVLE